MTVFTKELTSYRIATTNRGDTIQTIAARELGDPNRWPELVWVNSLSFPYITDDEDRLADGVLLTGAFIKIPAPTGVVRQSDPVGQVFERDVRMSGRQLRADVSGDFDVVSGSPNLVQQLQHRLSTPKGQLFRHPGYGCSLYRLLGKVNGPTSNIMAASYAKATLLSDYRVSSVKTLTATTKGDTIDVTARVETIAGGTVDVLTG